MVIIRSRRKRGGLWYPEDRLKATLFGIFLPITIILSGVITKYVPGPVGLVGNLVCLFFTGVAVSQSDSISLPLCSHPTYFFLNFIQVDIVLTPCGAYVVDILHSRSAESAAVIK